MPAAKRPPPPPPAPQPRAAADVILDVEVQRGALHFVLVSIGVAPAHAVRVRLSRAVRDVKGWRVNDNPLFTQLEFMAPGRRLALFVDTFAGYAARRQPMRFVARLEWRDDAGQLQRRTLQHDLGAFALLRETF
jgi:hypothetical protein